MLHSVDNTPAPPGCPNPKGICIIRHSFTFPGGLVALLLIWLVTVPASVRQFDGWFWQSPLPLGNDLNDLQVLDENTVIATGNLSTVIRSDDGGATCEILDSGVFQDLNGIWFASLQNGWAVGDIVLMLRTSVDPM